MPSIFDMDPNDLPPRPKDDDTPVRASGKPRNNKRETLTPLELAKGKLTLLGLTELAMKTLQETMENADFQVAMRAAQIVLDRAGFGPKTTVDVNTTHMDLSSLSMDELAERANLIVKKIRTTTPAADLRPTGTESRPTIN